jgi:catechol 2,3-dioxygenase-like lactoylglutathione lyase family enzyme
VPEAVPVVHQSIKRTFPRKRQPPIAEKTNRGLIMIGYVTIGTNDLVRAAAFYDALLGELGAKRMMETDQFIAWSVRPDAPGLGVSKPFDKKAATVGNGVMVALEASSAAQVNALHRKALQLGGKDEGAPGPRGEGGFYAGYFRDLDGNKLNFFHFGQS